jgi:adenosine deaminase
MRAAGDTSTVSRGNLAGFEESAGDRSEEEGFTPRPNGGCTISREEELVLEVRRSAASRFWHASRHASLRQTVWQQAHAIVHALEHPELGAWIVGLDVAGSEADAPNEVFAPAMRFVRAWTTRRDHGSARRLFGPRTLRHKPLRITCHAGEDFDHLIGGLRAVDEALEFLAMEPGDRIGHGLALGYEPEAWAYACGGSIQHRAGPWLDDLVWFRSQLLGAPNVSDVLAEVESQIAELAFHVYGPRLPTAELLQRAWHWRSEDPVLARELGERSSMLSLPTSGRGFALGCLRARGYDPERSDVKLWHAYDQDPRVRERSLDAITVPLPEHWFPAMTHVQERMLARLARMRVAIEINPSSNTSVGLLRDLSEHPVFRWYGPGEQRDDAPFIVVGSDDPGIFGTELLHEYAFLARAAANRGASPRAIKRWLEELRQTSIDFCFVPEAGFPV